MSNPRKRDAAIKEALLSQMKGKVPLEDVVEWLWEDFGIRSTPSWDRLAKIIISEKEILPQDLAAFMISEGLMPDEGAWDAMPVARGPRGFKKAGEDDRGG